MTAGWVTAAGWHPPPQPALFGELTRDGQRIILIGQGNDWELRRIAEQLAHLTPLVKKESSDAASVPCSWPAITQLAHEFTGNGSGARWVPGGALQAWIKEEFTRRTAPPAPLIAEFPPWLKLRPYQEEGAAAIANTRKFLLCDEPGPQPVSTPVWTPDGWRELGSLVSGDIVYDLHGRQVPVRAVKYFGEQPVYRVTFSDRTSTLATAEHRWRVWTGNDRSSQDARRCREGYRFRHGRVLSTEQLLAAGLKASDDSAAFFLPQQPVLQSRDDNAELPLDPYAYGALLGDGSLTHPGQFTIIGVDDYILSRVEQAALALGTTFKRYARTSTNCTRTQFHQKGELRAALEDLGACKLAVAKSVDPRYLAAGERTRRELLAGLLDTDGHVIANGSAAGFTTCSAQLAADVSWLARSLGAVVNQSPPRKGGRSLWQVQDRHYVGIRFPADGPNPFRVPRKAEAWTTRAAKNRHRLPSRSFRSINPAGTAEVCCIELDTDDDLTQVYLTDTALIPTHNCGKTATTIAGLAEIQAQGGEIFPMVIVTPSWDVCDVWMRELAAWKPEWRAPVVHGGPSRAGRLGSADIYLVTYATARIDAATADGPLCQLKPRSVVGDEIHFCKGNSTKQSLAFRRIAAHASTVVGLTGTPITRDTGDVFPALNAMDPSSWPARDRFVKRYCDRSQGEYGETIEGLNSLREPELRIALTGGMRRVAKADVLEDLPPKIYSVRRVELPDTWRRAYDQMEADMLADLPDDSGELPAFATITQMMFLARIASSAGDATVTEEPDEATGELKKHYHYEMKAPSWKADALMEILAERPGQPVACFAPYKPLVLIAGQQAEAAGLRVGYVTGTGDGITRGTRQQAITDFQAGRLDLLACTTGAGGTGITLTAAGTLVFLQRPWPLGDSIQSEDRCLAAGTPVLTPGGWIPVEDLRAGDEVVTRTGEVRPVIDEWSQQSKRIMAEISVTGQGPITCTADHRFLLRDGTWREAGSLRPGDWLAMPGNDITAELRSLPFKGIRIADTFENAWGSIQPNGRLRHAPETIQVTDDFLYVLGYFAGDGFASTGSDKGRFISFSGNPGTKAAALDRCERWASSTGLQGKRHHRTGSQSVEQRFFSAEWAYWFKAMFTDGQTGAAHKRLPRFALKLNERQSQVVLDGLNASDGYKRDSRPRREYVTMSRRLAANVLQLATRCGYRPSLTNGSTGQLIVAFGGTPGPRSPGRVSSVLLRHPLHLPGEVRERVYDITVKDAETFVAGGIIVHNSHRLGSEIHEHGVEFIDIVAKNTVDSRIRERLVEKGGQLSAFVRDPRVVRELLGGLRS